MNKSDLINAIVDAADGKLSKTRASDVLDAVLESITTKVACGGTVTLVGFGSFKAVKRAARSGRNPATGEALAIAAATVPKFTPGGEFKARVNAITQPAKAKK